MARHTKEIAEKLGAKPIGKVPRTSGGAFGAARMARVLAERLSPSAGKRPGRPTNATWVHHPKVPMSAETRDTLAALAGQISSPQRRVSPMQVAAQILEESVERYAAEHESA
jgi:hypothetical protein